jgi:predicted RNase H-like nuclease (RuvC/YqgF family)
MAVQDVLVLVKDVALPVIGGVASAVAAIWRLGHKIIAKIHKRLDVVESQLKEFDETIDSLQAKVRELDGKNEALKAQAEALSRETEAIRRALYKFTEEEAEKWIELNRELGNLEGFVRGRESLHDALPSTIPPPRAPRPMTRR